MKNIILWKVLLFILWGYRTKTFQRHDRLSFIIVQITQKYLLRFGVEKCIAHWKCSSIMQPKYGFHPSSTHGCWRQNSTRVSNGNVSSWRGQSIEIGLTHHSTVSGLPGVPTSRISDLTGCPMYVLVYIDRMSLELCGYVWRYIPRVRARFATGTSVEMSARYLTKSVVEIISSKA